MTEQEHFYRLKQAVLLKYKEYYPFFQGNWKSFSAQDIQNLIGLIEEHCKQTISEKWIYTHLKPETNSKIPRKDMLNILAVFAGYSGWDEFVYKPETSAEGVAKLSSKKRNPLVWLVLSVLIIGFGIWCFMIAKEVQPETKTIELQNEFTNEKVKADEVKVVQVEDSVEQPLKVKDGKVEIQSTSGKETKVVVKSPFYKPKTVIIASGSSATQTKQVALTPDDYPMMLKAFMVSDIKDWQTRKEQLNKILSDDLEVIVMLKNNLGAEYFDKNEFSQKLIVPTAALKRMKIIELKSDENNKIQFIRIKQE